MSSLITTNCVFYYGHVVTRDNYQLNFNEGSGERTANLNIGSYTLSEFAVEVARAMNSAENATLTYTVTVDRDTRLITIAGSGTFSLLISSGTNSATSVFSLAGFNGADLSGSASYEGDTASGSEYVPQYLLQKYVDPDIYKDPTAATVNESASGLVEVVTFGDVRFMECDIRFATDIDQGTDGAIETNLTGVQDLIDFMDAITEKSRIEFMKDRDTRSTFVKYILESTPSNKSGVGYKLKERTDLNIPGYFDTGVLKFRKVT